MWYCMLIVCTVFHIITGRWCGLRRDERICKMCNDGQVEDVEHFLLHCNGLAGEKGDGEVDE